MAFVKPTVSEGTSLLGNGHIDHRQMLHGQLQEKNGLSFRQASWSLEAIAMTFGQWETAGYHDPRQIDCHAHAHILLTSPFVSV